MTTKYDHLTSTNYLSNLCKDGTPLRGRIALLSFPNNISAKRIDAAIMIIESAQLLVLFLLTNKGFHTEQVTHNLEIYNVLSVFVKAFAPGTLLPLNKDGVQITNRVLEFCLAFYLLRILLFFYIIWLAWKRKTGSRLLVRSWQWIFHLQTKVLFQIFVSVYSNIYEAACNDLFEFNVNHRDAYMAGCVVLLVFEFLFSIVLTTQFTNVLPFKRFSASKDNSLELNVLTQKFTIQFLRRLLSLSSTASLWICSPINIAFSLARIYHFLHKLPVYNYKALKLQMHLLISTSTLSVASFANVVVNLEKGNMNFIIITWIILNVLCNKLAFAYLDKKLWRLTFEKSINTKRSPETLVHKIIFIKQIIKQNTLSTKNSLKSEIYHLLWSTVTRSSPDLECKAARNKIFMHYLEDLMAQFPKNNFLKLYTAYYSARKNKLYGLSIKTLAEIKNSKYPTVVTSKSILKNFIENKTRSDYQNGAYLFNLYDYCKGVADLSNLKLKMAEQAKLQWALCHEISSVGPDLAEILRLGNKAYRVKQQIHKNFKRISEQMPEYHIKPLLLYAYYHLLLGYNSGDHSKYKDLSSKRSQKYHKQFENDKLVPENLFQENTLIIVVSGEKETAGLINYVSPGFVEIFGRNLTGNHASIITPPFIRPNTSSVVKALMGQNALAFQNIERCNYLYHSKGYMVPSNYYLNINPSIYGGLSFIFICRTAHESKDLILLNEDGEIDSFTKNIGELLGLLSSNDGCYDVEAKTLMSQICPEFTQVNQAFNIVASPSPFPEEKMKIIKRQVSIHHRSPKVSQSIMSQEEAKELYHIYSKEGKDIILTPAQKANSGLQYRCVVKPLIIEGKVGKIITLEKIHTNQEIISHKNSETSSESIDPQEDLREDVNSEWINFDRLKSEQQLATRNDLPIQNTLPSPRNLISSPRIPLIIERGATETNEKLLNFDDQVITSLDEIPTKTIVPKKKGATQYQPHWLRNDQINVSKLYQQALEKPYRYPFFYRVFIIAIYTLFLTVFIMYSYMGANMHQGVSDLQVSKKILRMAQARNNYLGTLDATTRFLWTYATEPSSITKFFQGTLMSLPVIIVINRYAVGLLETENNNLFKLTSSLSEEQRGSLFQKDIRMFDVNSTTSLGTYTDLTSFQATDRVIEASLKSFTLALTNIKSAIPYLKFVLNNIMNDMLIKNTKISESFGQSLQDKKDHFEDWITICFSCSLCFLVFILLGYIYVLYLQANNESNNLFALTKLKPQSIHSLKQDFLIFHDIVLEDDDRSQKVSSSDPFSKIISSSRQARHQQRQFPIYKKLWPVYYMSFMKVGLLILILITLFLLNFVLFKRYLNSLSTKASEIYFIEELSSRLGVISGSFLEVTSENDTTILENIQASKSLSNQISQLSEIIQRVSDTLGVEALEESDLTQDILYGDACIYLKESPLLVTLCQALANYQKKPGLKNLLSNIESSIKLLYSKFVNSDRSSETLLSLQVEAFNGITTPVFLVLQVLNKLIAEELNSDFENIVSHSQTLNITLTAVILVLIVVESLIIHFLITSRLKQKETQFKQILGLFPASVVLPNFILKSYIMKYSNQTFNSFRENA